MINCQRYFVTEPVVSQANIKPQFAIEAADWVFISAPNYQDTTVSVHFQNKFTLNTAVKLRFHVSADQQYVLSLDKQIISRGPHRCDIDHWSFLSYEVELSAGEHVFDALVHWYGVDSLAPLARLTWRPGFIFAAEGDLSTTLNTGSGTWVAQADYSRSYDNKTTGRSSYTGSCLCQDARIPLPAVSDQLVIVRPAIKESKYGEEAPGWKLWPSNLLDLIDQPICGGKIRAVYNNLSDPLVGCDNTPVFDQLVSITATESADIAVWQNWLDHNTTIEIPAGQTQTVIIDWDNYYVGLSTAALIGAAGASVKIYWLESFYETSGLKRNRDEIIGKRPGVLSCDEFISSGTTESETFEGVFWRSGRYVLLTLTAPATGPARLSTFIPRECRYPQEMTSSFSATDSTDQVIPLMVRGMQSCSLETNVDCPFYEQLMYVGDCRIALLIQYVMNADTRFPQRAIELFEWSRNLSGFVAERYPSRHQQRSFTYALIWPSMVRDYLFWRGDTDWVKRRLPAVRGILESSLALLSEDNLLPEQVVGWSFVDWVSAWDNGIPPAGSAGSIVNLHLVMALSAASELEDALGFKSRAKLWSDAASQLSQQIVRVFWDDARGMLADNREKTHFSEHALCLALQPLFTCSLDTDSQNIDYILPEEKRQRAIQGLLSAPDLARTTVYFSFYLFEVYKQLGRGDLLLKRLDFWHNMLKDGLKTPLEAPEPSRSDCHAWSSHPLFHYFASIAGIRPTAPGFQSVEIAPSPGNLPLVNVVMPHPNGEIRVKLSFDQSRVQGEIALPAGVSGTWKWRGKVRSLNNNSIYHITDS